MAAYQRNTTDLLLNRNIPAILGFSSRALANVGEVRNRGLEFQLNTANVQGKSFTWNTAANLSFNRNQVIALSGANEQLTYRRRVWLRQLHSGGAGPAAGRVLRLPAGGHLPEPGRHRQQPEMDRQRQPWSGPATSSSRT